MFCRYFRVVSGLLWYHSSVSTAVVSAHPYLNFALGAAFEVPGRILNVLFIKFITRRKGAIIAFGATTVGIVIYCLLPIGWS